jgi:hypothetical protein
MRERLLRSLEEASVPFRMARKTDCVEEGWLQAVRQAVGMTLPAQNVSLSKLF